MKYLRTAAFVEDYRGLSPKDREAFETVARTFAAACERFVEDRDPAVWPAELGVKALEGAPDAWQVTWPAGQLVGRATWEWTWVDTATGREPAVLWRRLAPPTRHELP